MTRSKKSSVTRMSMAKGWAAVTSRVPPAKKRALSKFGAFVRRSSRSSIRKRKKSASAGKPPSSHSPEPNLRTIFFAFDPQTESVVVGPVLIGGKSGPPVPQLQEKGGRTQAVVKDRRGGRRVEVRTYQPHPFMGPALDKEGPKFPDVWKDTIRP